MKVRRNYLTLVAAVASSLLFCSCRDNESRERIAKLEVALGAQKDAHTKLSEWAINRDGVVNKQITFVAKEVFKTPQDKHVAIDPNGKGYAIVESNNGTFLVACDDAKPHLDGHKLILRIGNPYYMKYAGFTLHARFGARPPEYPKDGTQDQIAEWQKKNDEWQNTLKQRDLSFPNDLPAGAWTRVEMILAPSKPEEVGYVSVSMTTNEVSLQQPKE